MLRISDDFINIWGVSKYEVAIRLKFYEPALDMER